MNRMHTMGWTCLKDGYGQILSSWVRHKRPRGCPRFTYGRGLNKALKKAKVEKKNWQELASDRALWGAILKRL